MPRSKRHIIAPPAYDCQSMLDDCLKEYDFSNPGFPGGRLGCPKNCKGPLQLSNQSMLYVLFFRVRPVNVLAGEATLRPGFFCHSGGSSSPSNGGFPLPARSRIRKVSARSARRPLSRKYSSVRKAETFSATATLISWLTATPSSSATLRNSSSKEGCSRNAKLLRLIVRIPETAGGITPQPHKSNQFLLGRWTSRFGRATSHETAKTSKPLFPQNLVKGVKPLNSSQPAD